MVVYHKELERGVLDTPTTRKLGTESLDRRGLTSAAAHVQPFAHAICKAKVLYCELLSLFLISIWYLRYLWVLVSNLSC